MPAVLAPADRYKHWLDDTLTQAVIGRALPTPQDRPPERLSIERGASWAWLLASPGDPAPLAMLSPLWGGEFEPGAVEVFDGCGHARQAYGGLLCYAALQALAASDRNLLDEQADAATRWIDATGSALDVQLASLPEALPASDGDNTAALAWWALAVFRGGELLDDPRGVAASRRAMRAIAARQRAAGGYLAAEARDNPETLWFHELQIAHAVGSYAMQSDDIELRRSAARAAQFHMEETQPDHATNQPWALSAFLIDGQTHIMADGLLHAATVQHPGRLDAITLILLADTLYSLRRQRSR
jgi:hypothetical protein